MNISIEQLKRQMEALENHEKPGEGFQVSFHCRDCVTGEAGPVVWELKEIEPNQAGKIGRELVWVLNL